MNRSITLPALVVVALLGACGKKGTAPVPAAQLEQAVYTTFYPTTYMTKRIVGDVVPVHCPLPPDEDAIFWQPSSAAMERYRGAALVVTNGAEFEKWAMTAPLARSRVVDSASQLDGELLSYEDVTHSHGPAGDHTHEGVDGHTWVDPKNAIAQAGVIRDALIRTWPEHEAAFNDGYAALEADLKALHARLEALAPRLEGVKLFASHPAYNYLARRLDWDLHSMDLDPEMRIAGAAIDELRAAVGEGAPGTVVMLWEGEPIDEAVAQLDATCGAKSILFSPAENVDEASEGDYLAIMNGNVDRLEAALE